MSVEVLVVVTVKEGEIDAVVLVVAVEDGGEALEGDDR